VAALGDPKASGFLFFAAFIILVHNGVGDKISRACEPWRGPIIVVEKLHHQRIIHGEWYL
jgi:hypothetical protein